MSFSASHRIDQWRICFRWRGEDAFDVEIVDYH
jgi:toxin HigB-1